MIAISRGTFIIKVLFFILSLLSIKRLEDDTHIKCSITNIQQVNHKNQANKQKMFKNLKNMI